MTTKYKPCEINQVIDCLHTHAHTCLIKIQQFIFMGEKKTLPALYYGQVYTD